MSCRGLVSLKFFAPCFCRCVLRLQSRSCFSVIFCFLSLSSVYQLPGLSFAKCFGRCSCYACVVRLHTREFHVRSNFLFPSLFLGLLFMSSRGSVSLILLPPRKLIFLRIQCGSYIFHRHFLFTWLRREAHAFLLNS